MSDDTRPAASVTEVHRLSDNGDGICLWSHATGYSLDEILKPEYWRLFIGARGGGLARHDRLEVTCKAGTRNPDHALLVVTEVEPGAGVSMDVLRRPGKADVPAPPAKKTRKAA